MISKEALHTASQCRQYAMCKIDYLGTGLCPAGQEHHFVSYFPQGRMGLARALATGKLEITPRLLEIAHSCTLCGVCDLQCHFISELRPLAVMRELKEHVEGNSANVRLPAPDPLIDELIALLGERWVSNDPAITLMYASDPSPITVSRTPRAVVLPQNVAEVQGVLRIARKHGVPFNVRGNGSSVMGFVMTDGILIDTQRMKTFHIDEEQWLVTVGAGVSAFELQKAVTARGYRVNVAEPAALVCANLLCSGIMSLFSTAYGTLADGVVDAELVDASSGDLFHLNDRRMPNLSKYVKEDRPLSVICTSAQIKLQPMTQDEEGVLVPFQSLDEALRFLRECSIRRIGFGLGVLGADYLATFMTSSMQLAREAKGVFNELLGIPYVVLVLGDKKDRRAVRQMARTVLSNALFRALMLGLPKLTDGSSLSEVLKPLGESNDEPLVRLLGHDDILPILETVLESSPKTLAEVVPDDLRADYERLYLRPEMTDLVWLNMFRILSTRMGREKHLVPLILYVPLERTEVTLELVEGFRKIAQMFGLKNDLGFVSPIDFGKRAFLEYDFYLDQNDQDEIARTRQALGAAAGLIGGISARVQGVKWIRYTLNQGLCRKESLLYTV